MIRCTHQDWYRFEIKGFPVSEEDSGKEPPDENPCQKPATYFFIREWSTIKSKVAFTLDARCDEHCTDVPNDMKEITCKEYVIYQVMGS